MKKINLTDIFQRERRKHLQFLKTSNPLIFNFYNKISEKQIVLKSIKSFTLI